MTERKMTAWQLDFSLRGLLAAVVETVRNPRDAAARLVAMDLPLAVIWTMLGAVSAVSVVLVEGSLLLVESPDEAGASTLPNPFLMFGLQLVLSALSRAAQNRTVLSISHRLYEQDARTRRVAL